MYVYYNYKFKKNSIEIVRNACNCMFDLLNFAFSFQELLCDTHKNNTN